MNAAELIQGSPEWLAARCGSLGASAVHDVMARTKSGPAASRANCLSRLVLERLTGVPLDTYQTAAMQHGIACEPEAVAAYGFYTGADVREVGLIPHPSIAGTHASPDRLVGDVGLLEVKCPQPTAHLEVLLSHTVPSKYALQIQWQLACTGRAWGDFVSYNPQFPEALRMFTRRLERDDARIAEVEAEVRAFLAEVDATVAKLTAQYETRLAAHDA